MARLRRTQASEHEIQSAYFDWIEIQAQQDERYGYIYSVPNGGQRHIAVARKMVREGVRRGILDVCIDYPVSRADSRLWTPGGRIEFKSGRNKTTTDQDLWICKLLKAGYCVAISYSWEAAAAWTKVYFSGELNSNRCEIIGR